MPRARTIRVLLSMAVLALAAMPTSAARAEIPSTLSQWYQLPGLTAGSGAQWVRSITYSTPPNIVYAGLEAGGVFRSTNGGITWSAFNSGFPNPALTNVRAILTSSTGDTVFAGTDDGIWKSQNGGAWQRLAQGPEADPANPKKLNGSVQSLASFPGNVMLAGVIGSAYGTGVFKSTDGGETWKPPAPGNGMSSTDAVYSIVGHPSPVPAFVLAASSNGVWRSTDMGSTWSLTSDGIPTSASPIQVWVDTSKPNILYVSTGSDGIYRSINGGITWSPINKDLLAVRARGFQIFTGNQGAHLYAATENALWHAVQTHENPPAGFLPKEPSWQQVTKTGLATPAATNEIMWALTAPVIPGAGALGLIAGTQSDGGFFLAFEAPKTDCPDAADNATPSNAAACPSIGGALPPTPGDVLNVNDLGTWEGTAPLSFDKQWQRCNTASETSPTCSDIPGETDLTYVVKETDQGKFFRVIIKVTNPAPTFGLVKRRTRITAATEAAPSSMPGFSQQTNPGISPSSTIAVGDTLTATPGQAINANSDGWFNPKATTRTWEWLRCEDDSDVSKCTVIPGAGGAEPGGKSYTLTAADGTRWMRVRVKGTASGLTNELTSGTTFPVVSAPAEATVNPSIFGNPYVGETLGGSVGAWKDPTTGYYRRWLKCEPDGGVPCVIINKEATVDPEDGPTYTVRAGDLGQTIRLRVTADVNGDADNEQNNFNPPATVFETDALKIIERPPPTGGGGTPGGGGGLPGGGGGTPGGGTGPDLVAPVLSGLKLSPSTFALAKGKTASSAAAKKGTTFRFSLSEAATVTLAITKPSAGRKVGKTCKKATKKLRKRAKCVYQAPVVSLVRKGQAAGARSVKFTGRVGRKSLSRGSYLVTATARDAAGNRSKARTATFKVVRK